MRYLFVTPIVRAVVLAVLGVILSLVISSRADAQELPTFDVPGKVDVSWTLPTETACINPADQDPETCERLPLTGVLALTGLELYVSTAPIPDDFSGEPSAVIQPGLVTTTYNGVVPAGATLHFRMKARNRYGVSAFTREVTKDVPMPNVAPGVPTNVTVEIVVGVASATP